MHLTRTFALRQRYFKLARFLVRQEIIRQNKCQFLETSHSLAKCFSMQSRKERRMRANCWRVASTVRPTMAAISPKLRADRYRSSTNFAEEGESFCVHSCNASS